MGALPTGSAVLGPADSQQPAGADVVLQPRDPAALQSFAAAVSTPGSPSYRDYLSTAAFRQEFGPRPQTVTAVRVWLAGSGLALGATSANGMIVPVSGTVGRLEQVFAVPLVRARLPGGRVARAVTADPEVPASLAPAVEGVVGLSTVVEAHPQLATDPLAPHPTTATGAVGPSGGVAGTIGPDGDAGAACRTLRLPDGRRGRRRLQRLDGRQPGLGLRALHPLRCRPGGSRTAGRHLRAGAVCAE